MSVQTLTGARAELEARAGASDQDREQWLAERRAGVTATEVRDLALGKLRVQDLVDLKLGRKVDDFNGNAYTAWGKDREVVIANDLRGAGIAPESRVFHHPENSRHLASPDGIGVGFDDELLVSEIKTCGHALPIGSAALYEKGYLLQIQWVMHVIGADRCLLVVEERINVAGGFAPGPRDANWVERDDAIIAELVTIADAFLAELDRQREEGAPVIDEELDTHAVNYLRAIDEEKRWKALKEDAYRAVVAAGKSQESPLARVTFTPEKPGEVLEVEEVDYEAARATHFGAALFAELQSVTDRWNEHLQGFISTKQVVGKGRAASARITAGKGTRS